MDHNSIEITIERKVNEYLKYNGIIAANRIEIFNNDVAASTKYTFCFYCSIETANVLVIP